MPLIKQETDSQNNEIQEDEPPLDQLVHSKEMLKKVIFPFPEVRNLRKCNTMRQCLVGCLVVCMTRINETVVVDEVVSVTSTSIMFKHSTTLHLFDDLEYTHVNDKVFELLVDQLATKDEPLPLYSLYFARKMNVLKLWREFREINKFFEENGKPTERTTNLKNIKTTDDAGTSTSKESFWTDIEQKASKELVQIFGADTQEIMVTPWQLVQLLQLGRREFERVVVGLYVCCLFTVSVGVERCFIDRIRKVTWGAVTYEMYGKQLNALLHFEAPNAGPCPVFAVQFPSPAIDQELLHNRQAEYEFIPPSSRHIELKKRHLQEAIIKTMNGSLLLNETDKNCFNRASIW